MYVIDIRVTIKVKPLDCKEALCEYIMNINVPYVRALFRTFHEPMNVFTMFRCIRNILIVYNFSLLSFGYNRNLFLVA